MYYTDKDGMRSTTQIFISWSSDRDQQDYCLRATDKAQKDFSDLRPQGFAQITSAIHMKENLCWILPRITLEVNLILLLWILLKTKIKSPCTLYYSPLMFERMPKKKN